MEEDELFNIAEKNWDNNSYLKLVKSE